MFVRSVSGWVGIKIGRMFHPTSRVLLSLNRLSLFRLCWLTNFLARAMLTNKGNLHFVLLSIAHLRRKFPARFISSLSQLAPVRMLRHLQFAGVSSAL